MMRLTMMLTLGASTLLAGCGLRGDLVRPEPSGSASAAPRAGEGRAEGQDSRSDQDQADPVVPATSTGEVPPISQAPLDGTNDPVGRPPTVTQSGPR